MARHGSEAAWGSAMTGLGLLQLATLRLLSREAKLAVNLLAAGMWGFLAWFFFLGRLDSGFFDALTSPGVFLFAFWGIALGKMAFKLK